MRGDYYSKSCDMDMEDMWLVDCLGNNTGWGWGNLEMFSDQQGGRRKVLFVYACADEEERRRAPIEARLFGVELIWGRDI